MISTVDLLRLRSGDLTFDDFALATRKDFVKLAQKLTIGAPPWLDVEDVAHEMIMSVPATLQQWRDGDYSVKRFVVFRACSVARKAVKRARDYRDFEGRQDQRDDYLPAAQHSGLELKERVGDLMVRLPRTPMQRAVMQSLINTQNMERTADELISHPDTRVMFAADRDLVHIKIRRVMSILADRAQEHRQAQERDHGGRQDQADQVQGRNRRREASGARAGHERLSQDASRQAGKALRRS